MKRFHLALGVPRFQEAVADFQAQLGIAPVLVIEETYALFRTETMNISLRKEASLTVSQLRHCGWEDPFAKTFSEQKDTNGLIWEHFTREEQLREIKDIWPETDSMTFLSTAYPEYTPFLETERLLLRPFLSTDLEDIYTKWASDPEVTRYTAWDLHQSYEDTRCYLERLFEDYERGRPSQWAVVHKGDQSLIGSIGFNQFESSRGDIGYALSKAYWNRGLMTEALVRVLAFGFSKCGAHRLQAFCDVEHGASCKVMEKAGMVFEGILKGYCSANGRYHDVRLYAKLKS